MRVSIELSEAELAWVDRAVANGLFENRDAAIRGVIDGSLGTLDDAAIGEAYRRAYAAGRGQDWASKAGLDFLADSLQADRPGS